MTEIKKCEVRPVGDGFDHVPFGVYLGKILVTRHAEEAEAIRVRDKLNLKIERRAVLDVVARIREDVRSAQS
jgi:hypothetical protein